jgi:hypothetical protein
MFTPKDWLDRIFEIGIIGKGLNGAAEASRRPVAAVCDSRSSGNGHKHAVNSRREASAARCALAMMPISQRCGPSQSFGVLNRFPSIAK